MAYLWLALGIVAEVMATMSLKFAEGFTKPLPSVLVIVGYGVAFFALSRVLNAGLGIGVTYAIWAALGIALVAVVGALFFHEQLNLTMVGGLVLILGGVTLLELGQAKA